MSENVTRRSVLRKGAVASGALVGGGIAVVGSSEAHPVETEAFVDESVTKDETFTLLREIGPETVHCDVVRTREGIRTVEFASDLEIGTRGGDVFIVDPHSYNENDLVQVKRVIGDCDETDLTEIVLGHA